MYVNVVFLFSPQKYRHVDNIMFENHTIADRFLDFWRKTGSQRMGYLYGRYTEHKDIPLGIRAEVAAIYEPPQVGHSLWAYYCLILLCKWNCVLVYLLNKVKVALTAFITVLFFSAVFSECHPEQPGTVGRSQSCSRGRDCCQTGHVQGWVWFPLSALFDLTLLSCLHTCRTVCMHMRNDAQYIYKYHIYKK